LERQKDVVVLLSAMLSYAQFSNRYTTPTSPLIQCQEKYYEIFEDFFKPGKRIDLGIGKTTEFLYAALQITCTAIVDYFSQKCYFKDLRHLRPNKEHP
jgi:hypothetical protein